MERCTCDINPTHCAVRVYHMIVEDARWQKILRAQEALAEKRKQEQNRSVNKEQANG